MKPKPKTSAAELSLDRYPGIRPFRREEEVLFFGRNKEIEEVLNAIKIHDLFVLFSKSGLGKSSLLNAGIIPRLVKEEMTPVVIRFLNREEDPLQTIITEIKKYIPRHLFTSLPASLQNNLWGLFSRWSTQNKPVLVFDQFEEFFFSSESQRQHCIAQIAGLLNAKVPEEIIDILVAEEDIRVAEELRRKPPVKVLFLIRSDRLSFLEELSVKLPNVLNNRYELKPLKIEKAEQAIVLPAQLKSKENQLFRSVTFEYSIDALKILIEVLGRGGAEIESSQLQLVCQEMERIAGLKSQDSTAEVVIEPTDFLGVTGIRDILNRFYENQLLKLKADTKLRLNDDDIKVIRRLIENELLIGNKRINQAEGKVKELLTLVKPSVLQIDGIAKEDFIINELLNLRLIREEETHLGKVYEISHDTLVEAIVTARDRQVKNREKLLQESKRKKQLSEEENASGSTKNRQCFVVMGFGIKTDLATGRKLNLDKSYMLLIKPVVEKQGLTCVRADEIRHSGTLDLPIYEKLLTADVVIADLSSANLNTFYQLGIRHALRPRTTIIMAESKLVYPFDISHISVLSYDHLGDAIDYEEVLRFQKVLGDRLLISLVNSDIDSPVYTYLDQLLPPSIKQSVSDSKHFESQLENSNESAALSFAVLREEGKKAVRNREYDKAKALFNTLLVSNNLESSAQASDADTVQMLVLATYKAAFPDPVSALKEAHDLLEQFDPGHTNDPEVLELAAKIQKGFYENGQGDEHLSNAISFYERGYYLFKNRYNGINLSFLYHCRAHSSLSLTVEEKIADIVFADRIRREVLVMCEKDWHEIMLREERPGNISLPLEDKKLLDEQKFWILVNKAEAYFGLRDENGFHKSLAEADVFPHELWMMQSFHQQLEKLKALMDRQPALLESLRSRPDL